MIWPPRKLGIDVRTRDGRSVNDILMPYSLRRIEGHDFFKIPYQAKLFWQAMEVPRHGITIGIISFSQLLENWLKVSDPDGWKKVSHARVKRP